MKFRFIVKINFKLKMKKFSLFVTFSILVFNSLVQGKKELHSSSEENLIDFNFEGVLQDEIKVIFKLNQS